MSPSWLERDAARRTLRMFSSWRLPRKEHVEVHLAPGEMRAFKQAGWSRRFTGQHAEAFPMPPVPAGPPWSLAVAAVARRLGTPGWRDRPVRIVLSGAFAHHAVVPGGKVLAPTVHEALARAVFVERYGEAAHDWRLRVSPAGTRPTLACGVPASLLDALGQACEGRASLHSIQSLLMHVFNRFRRQFTASDGTLIVVEPNRLTLAAWADGEWQSVIGRAGSGDALPQMLMELDTVGMRLPGRAIWLFDPGKTALLPPEAERDAIRLGDEWPPLDTTQTASGDDMADAPPGSTS